MRTAIGILLALLIVGASAMLLSYATVAIIVWEPHVALWDEQARSFMTFLFWGQIVGFTLWKMRP